MPVTLRIRLTSTRLAPTCLAAFGAAALLLTASAAHAQDAGTKAACVSAFDASQSLRRDGKLTAAREKLVACSQPQCPDVVESKCSEWLTEVDAALPSLTIVVPSGVSAAEMRVWIDGREHPEAVQGRPVVVDPGSHTIEYRHRGGAPSRTQIVVAQGEKAKPVQLTVATAPTPTPTPGPRPAKKSGGISPLVFVGFGVAGAGLIAGGVTGGLALSKASELEEGCANQQCTPELHDTYDSGNTLAHVSTVSFALAGAGAVVGVVGLLLPSDKGADRAWTPVVGPGYAGVSGRF